MANITLYNASIPQFKTGLTVLSRILTKAALHFPNSPDSILTATLIELYPLRAVERVNNQQKASGYNIQQLWTSDKHKLPEQLSAISTIIVDIDGILLCETASIYTLRDTHHNIYG
ncbi:hypothetical protein CGCA056_v008074 [Colletotrichum aenigma]|uniref:uncharacterized protein n=1 Tax=Colletotrichum aenigma TaxID=1215731 RepID=UPI001872FC59|nr:uncharacterized protein CGCA056_v008074 [Colletotrichum aenigma]KAF5519946.1 hypothetical protein CGCA056_v008074 [Colletotrichum aenigma]